VPPLISSLPTRHKILVVGDEPDVFTLAKLSLKGLQYKGCRVELLHAATGRDTVRTMRMNPDIALILLDVVMETNSALEIRRRVPMIFAPRQKWRLLPQMSAAQNRSTAI
jgi:CheY-like chemotaxis protein